MVLHKIRPFTKRLGVRCVAYKWYKTPIQLQKASYLGAFILVITITEALKHGYNSIAILQGLQHKAMANRHECNECVIMKMPHKGCIQHSRVWRHYSIISPSQRYISARKLLITLVQGVFIVKKYTRSNKLSRVFRKSYTKVATRRKGEDLRTNKAFVSTREQS